MRIRKGQQSGGVGHRRARIALRKAGQPTQAAVEARPGVTRVIQLDVSQQAT
ncbi:hypothetical protein BSIN_3830 [Burkholderia singularis]|uniref:Uncharacterized protein n=1 Tax=Burkholderia singularis TaxID=1503053 RepID=A0A238H6M8_9BURK|nr:hypothetical protein BSIN_3830 [Burkholderia singularis]